MRYFHTKPENYTMEHGEIYFCNHPVYYRATLYLKNGKGLCVIQQRFDPITKHSWWGEIDPWLVDELYLHRRFGEYFNRLAGPCIDGLYPTVSIRQIMWSLKMKPIKREPWETAFDHAPI